MMHTNTLGFITMRHYLPYTFCLCLLVNTIYAAPKPRAAAPQISAISYFLQDFQSGKILAEKDPDLQIAPASITKLMTSYVVFNELETEAILLNDDVTISEKAWQTPGSRMFIEVDKIVSVEDLLKGMIVQSGNDASVALAEHVSGSEDSFAQLMNFHAQKLGMLHSNFINSTGLPADEHYSTARDIAILSHAIIEQFPEYYAWYAQKEFTFNSITQKNRNKLLWRDPTVDGLKTGHTDAAGYCLVTSARRDTMRLIAVIMGSKSEKSRATDSEKLLKFGFRFYETHQIYAANEELSTQKVWKGAREDVILITPSPVIVTIPRGQYERMEIKIDVKPELTAPLSERMELGRLRIMLDDEAIFESSLVAKNAVAEGSFWQRTSDGLSLWFNEIFGG